MAKITTLIPPQNFELIRDRIGLILTDEINNQFTLSEPQEKVPIIWIGRTIPFDKTEIPAINIWISKIDYSNKDARSVDGSNLYNIDVYTSSPDTQDEDGDKLAMLKLHKIAGMCRAILENPIYWTLDFAPPFNGSSSVSSMLFLDPVNNPDMVNHTVGRIEFSVRCQEGVVLKAAPLIESSSSSIKLNQTDKGYCYQYESN